jgi:hypothetical protein
MALGIIQITKATPLPILSAQMHGLYPRGSCQRNTRSGTPPTARKMRVNVFASGPSIGFPLAISFALYAAEGCAWSGS